MPPPMMIAISTTYLCVEMGRAHVVMYRSQDHRVVKPDTLIVDIKLSAHLTSAMTENVMK